MALLPPENPKHPDHKKFMAERKALGLNVSVVVDKKAKDLKDGADKAK